MKEEAPPIKKIEVQESGGEIRAAESSYKEVKSEIMEEGGPKGYY